MDFEHLFISVCCISAVLTLASCEDCVKIDNCRCKTSKGTVDLNKIPKTLSVKGDKGYTYTYQPCVGIQNCGTGTGNTIAVCQTLGLNSFDVGDQNTVNFSGDPAAYNSLKATYGSSVAGTVRTSIFTISCDANEDGKLISATEKPQNTYNLILKTKYACLGNTPSKKISTGSVLLILFFVFLVVYFVAGVLFLKFARGAQGTEMLPNYDFWTSLPGYIKDGVMFTCRGCKTESSYSQI